jgi:biopolymer transport protein ExbB
MKQIFVALCAMLVAVPGSASAQEWWSDDWGYRQALSVNAQEIVSDGIDNAPVLVRLHAGNVDFTRLKDDGSDLRFVTADGTPLDFHLESFNRQAEIALAWVKLPEVSSGSQTIYAYYGNGEASAALSPAGTYDGEQSLVVHFADGASPRDETANANTIGSFSAQLIPEGLIAGGARFGAESRMKVAASQSLTVPVGGSMTVSAWVKPASELPADAALYTKLGESGSRLVIGLRGATPYVSLGGAEAAAQAPLPSGSWAHLAMTAGEGVVRLYVDGTEVAQLAANLPELGGGEIVGANGELPAFMGDIDELWRANTARPAEFIAFVANSQGRDATVVQVSGEAQVAGESGGHNYLGILFGALTLDAWIVIAILAAMLVIAIAVMVLKAGLLSRVERANEAFRQDFRRNSSEAGLHDGLVNSDKLSWAEVSSLGRLFAVGREETRQRLAEGRRSARDQFALAPQSVAAIRAAMDAQMAREGQRLNARMVLLTIAISGGPFLGLLGTVIGVMITFAGVAAAGDVNINAIAPGIAAALLATVAGLAVAIPALFGYNWLLSRVEKIETDNQVFVDELEKRIAETYRPSVAAAAA